MGKNKLSFLVSLAFTILTLFTVVGCSSDDETPTTGFIRIEFYNWSKSLGSGDVYVYLAEQYENGNKICIKKVKIGDSKTTDIELNPGNYYVDIRMDKMWVDGEGYLQVQAGKTEIIKVSKKY